MKEDVAPITKDDIRWFQRYYELEQFKKKFGHTRVPAEWKENVSLANWVHSMRKRKNHLESWHQTMLNKLGFEWVIRAVKRPIPLLERDPEAFEKVKAALREQIIITTEDPCTFVLLDFQWYFMLLALIGFKQRFGHANVPCTWEEDRALVHWVMKQRKDKAKLPGSRVKALDAIGFVWRIYEVTRTPWERRFSQLIAYRKEFGHVNVPQSDPLLGRWVWMQRSYKEKMPEKRKRLLDRLGFIWEFNTGLLRQKVVRQKTDKLWEIHFLTLCEYVKAHGHCNIQPYWKEDLSLARWVTRQRSLYLSGLLPQDRFDRLDKLGFVWDDLQVNKLYRRYSLKIKNITYPAS